MYEPLIIESAHKHGVADDDMRHAYAHPTRIFTLDEGMTMIIGPARNAQLLEVGVVAGDDGPVIVHAMKARRRFLR